MNPNPTIVTITPTSEPTPELTPELDDVECARQLRHEMVDALYDCGWDAIIDHTDSKAGAEWIYTPATSVFREMTPYLEDIMECVKCYSEVAKTPFQAHPSDRDAANESVITDKKYVANVMFQVALGMGMEHPNAERRLNKVLLPDDAMRDYMRICFADYTDDMPLPKPEDATYFMPEAYPENIEIKHEDGMYIFHAKDMKHGSFYPYMSPIVIYMEHANSIMYEDKEGFRMCVVSISDPDHYTDAVGWMIYLVKNDEPDRLGINWRVEKIVRMPTMTNGIEICDGN